MSGMAGLGRTSSVAGERSLVQRKSLVGFRIACELMWGPAGYRAVCADLPPDVSERTSGMRPLPDWVALDDLIAWHVAVWNGLAKRDEGVMTKHIQATVDQSFGRVKRALLAMSTPMTLVPRSAALWQGEYSTGRLVASAIEGRSVQLTLRDHPYVEHHLMRFVISEALRHIVSLTQVRHVAAEHQVRNNKLIVVLRWT
jgi:hypothetical protein